MRVTPTCLVENQTATEGQTIYFLQKTFWELDLTDSSKEKLSGQKISYKVEDMPHAHSVIKVAYLKHVCDKEISFYLQPSKKDESSQAQV